MKSISHFMGMSLDELLKHFRSEFTISAGKGIERSKVLVAIERKKESTKSLTSYMNEQFGVVDSNAFKPVVVFRDLVTLNPDHTASDTAGHGGITEAQFDAIKSPRTFIIASAICNAITKQYGEKPEEAATWREELAVILRPAMDEGERRKLLDILKAKLKPADKDGAGECEGDDKEGEKGAGEKAVPLTPLALLGLLHGPASAAFWGGLAEHAKANPDSAQSIADALSAVSANAASFAGVCKAFVPTPAVTENVAA